MHLGCDVANGSRGEDERSKWLRLQPSPSVLLAAQKWGRFSALLPIQPVLRQDSEIFAESLQIALAGARDPLHRTL